MSWSLEEAIVHYRSLGAPGEQSALVGLLREIQRENGGEIPGGILEPVAAAYGLKESFLLALSRRIPSLRLANTHCLELCAGPNCGRQAALAAFAEEARRENPGGFTIKYVPCMRMCGKGPNLRWDGVLYHRADEALLRRLMKKR